MTENLRQQTDATAPRRIPVVFVGIESDESGKESPQHQLQLLREHPAANEGGRFCVGEFSESGHSGYSKERGPETQRAIEAAEDAAVEYGEAELWVFATNRLGRGDGKRGHRSYMKAWADLRYAEVQVRSLSDDEYATNTALVGIGSEQAHKFSADKSVHVRRGKKKQREQGVKLGGRIHDGYRCTVERDDRDEVVARLWSFDPEREALVRRWFELGLADVTDPEIARILFAEGWRTQTWTIKSGKRKGQQGGGIPISRQRVREVLLDPFYTGHHAYGWNRKTVFKGELVPGDHPAFISLEEHRYLCETRAPKATLRVSGKRPIAHALSGGKDGTGGCGHCGAPLMPTYSSYARKKIKPTYKKLYVCTRAHEASGFCTAGYIDAEVFDDLLLNHLDAVIDIPAWVEELVAARSSASTHLAEDIAREREAVAEAKRKEALFAERYEAHVEAGDEDLARADAAGQGKHAKLREEAEGRIEHLADSLARAEEPTPTDAMLDFANDLASGVRDALGKTAMQDVNVALGKVFRKFWVKKNEDGSISVRPELHPDAAVLAVLCVDGLRLVDGKLVNEAKGRIAADPPLLEAFVGRLGASQSSLTDVLADVEAGNRGEPSRTFADLLDTHDPDWQVAAPTALPLEVPALSGMGSDPW